MAMENYFSVAWETQVEPPRITSISSEHVHDHQHILALTESLSALGWMHKAYFDPVNVEAHDAGARWLGWTLVSHKTSLYSQNIRGTEKIIVDSLSQDFHMSEHTQTKKFN